MVVKGEDLGAGGLSGAPAGGRQVEKNGVRFMVTCPDPKIEDFWSQSFEKGWEDETFRIFDDFISADKIYLDFGAWIGPTVLYAAHRAKRVYGLEPDQRAFAILSENLRANPDLADKVTVLDQAIAPTNGLVEFYYAGDGADSTSSLIKSGAKLTNSYQVRTVTLADFVRENDIEPAQIGFIKIDIEGGEFDLARPLVEFLLSRGIKPDILLSTHRPRLKSLYKGKYAALGPFKSPAARIMTRRRVRDFMATIDIYQYKYETNGRRIDDLQKWAQPKGYNTVLLTDRPWLKND